MTDGTDITTDSDRAILRKHLGNLEVTILATDAPDYIEAAATIDGKHRVLGVKCVKPLVADGEARAAAIEMFGRGFRDLVQYPR